MSSRAEGQEQAPENAPKDAPSEATRRRVLAEIAAHLVPPRRPGDPEPAARLPRMLDEPRFANGAVFVWALVDEIEERAGGFGALGAERREALLRAVESEADPYLLHGLRLVLRLALEDRLAVRVDARLRALDGEGDARV